MVTWLSSYAVLLCYLQKREFCVQAGSYHTTYKASGQPSRLMASAAIEIRSNFSTQSLSTNDPVVSVDWLHANLREPDLKVLIFICGPVTLLKFKHRFFMKLF